MVILGIDIGGTNTRLGMVDSSLNVTNFEKVSSELIQGDDSAALLAAFILNYIARHGVEPDCVSIGFPSSLDVDRKRLICTPNMKGFDDLAIVEVMEKLLGLKVVVERDVNLLFRRDKMVMNLPDKGIIIAVYAGTGIGNVICFDGRIILGRNAGAADLGHVATFSSDRVCGCGNVGCVETVVSGRRLREIRDELYPDCDMEDLFTRHASDEALKRFVDKLAIAIAIEISILDPEYLILGGGVLNMKGFPIEAFEMKLRDVIRKPNPSENLRIRYSDGDATSGVTGAAIYAMERLTGN
ncbi:MAG: allose kinase, partial [Clostridia bacterium]|nr:allose kinase [Clostridia bacterium]